MSASCTIGRPGQFAEFERHTRRALEQASLRATSRVAKAATREVRNAMRSQGLGRLANAIGSGSDLEKKGSVHRGSGGPSASGWIHVRGKSARTEGALEAYLEGATIRPKRGKWLWIATDRIPKKAGRKKMTPELYQETGLDERIGPLRFVKGRGGTALYVVDEVSVRRDRPRGSARRLPKVRGLVATRRAVRLLVAFIGVRNTTRNRRLNAAAIIAAEAARLPAVMAEELRKEI